MKIKDFSKINKNKKKYFYRCKKCLVTSTRPRVEFKKKICSGCLNFVERKKINWKKRFYQLKKLCSKYRSNNIKYDIVVPVGGGKDSSYVAWVLKNKLKMNPLCVFVEPPLMTKIGKKNLENFEKSGFKVLRIKHTSFNKKLNKYFIKSLTFYAAPLIIYYSSIIFFGNYSDFNADYYRQFVWVLDYLNGVETRSSGYYCQTPKYALKCYFIDFVKTAKYLAIPTTYLILIFLIKSDSYMYISLHFSY